MLQTIKAALKINMYLLENKKENKSFIEGDATD
jgi:hypothetical protein